MKITAGRFSFNTKREAYRALQKVLHTDSLIQGEEEELLRAFLRRHPDADEKIGSGIQSFRRDKKRTKHGTTCFYVNRTDGSSVSFSYRSCVRGVQNP